MTYSVKEVYYTLQGEGANTGRPAVFCRFTGCNLWSGFEEDRDSAICSFCDTDFVGVDGPGGGKYSSASKLAETVHELWPGPSDHLLAPFVICTGGEPLLQLDECLIEALHERGFEVGIETNGTMAAPAGLDWVCVSPKAGTKLAVQAGNELKLVFPQVGAQPERFLDLAFDRFYLQPMDGSEIEQNTKLAMEYCLDHPPWRLSLQTHKFVGLP